MVRVNQDMVTGLWNKHSFVYILFVQLMVFLISLSPGDAFSHSVNCILQSVWLLINRQTCHVHSTVKSWYKQIV